MRYTETRRLRKASLIILHLISSLQDQIDVDIFGVCRKAEKRHFIERKYHEQNYAVLTRVSHVLVTN